MIKPNPKSCPELDFDDDDSYKEIIKWGEVKIKEMEPIGKVKTNNPFPAYYTMIWSYGFIETPVKVGEDIVSAEKYAAFFIYLWCKGAWDYEADMLSHNHI